ncbi:negative regulation of toll-like receptor 5 signaling pathway [Branchiostoma belcheri]|nr:negative regulation of toll-like receptor 5 signaling pathway [Branchiostoma belcheri]
MGTPRVGNALRTVEVTGSQPVLHDTSQQPRPQQPHESRYTRPFHTHHGSAGKLQAPAKRPKPDIKLPHPIMNVNPAMRVAMAEFLTDGMIQRHLEDARLLNWCLQTVKLTAVQTTGDGNCLLHAVAMYMWGVQDTECVLRRQLYNAIWADPHRVLREDGNEWAREWQLMVSMATPEPANPVSGQHCYRSLEEFHVFTLANILRRPIIIIADLVHRNVEGHSLAPVHFGGIYLPLLWRPQLCVRYPVVLAFHNQHFTPLMAEEAVPAPNGPASSQSMPPAQEQAIPLTGRDLQLLQVQYLQPREENRVMELLQQYLHIVEVPLGDDGRVPAALIDGPSVPAELNFITDLLQYDWSGQGAGGAGEAGVPQAEPTGSRCSQGAEGLSVSGQHQDQSLLADKLQQIANAIDAERLVVPTQAPGGTMGSQGGVCQQQNGPPSAGPPPQNRQTYAAAVATNLKTPQTTTPKRKPSFPLVDKTSPKK